MLHRLFIAFICFIAVACSKNENPDNPTQATPRIISFSPLNVTTGSTITITGENFGSSIINAILKLDSLTISISSLTSQAIEANIPQNLIPSGTKKFKLQIIINGVASNIIEITITYAPHGWRYVNKDFSLVNNPTPKSMYFFDDNNGFIFGENLFDETYDGGIHWGGVTPYGQVGEGFSVYNNNHVWLETHYYDFIISNISQQTSRYARIDTITTIPGLGNKIISGLFITKPDYGYMLTHEGSVYKITGGYAPSNIKLEFRSSYYTPLVNSFNQINFFRISGIDSMNFMIMGRALPNNVITPIIIHKKNGVYNEYNLTPVVGTSWPKSLQYVDANTAYMLTINYDLYKFNFSNNSWSKLNTPKFGSFYFVNANLGYASSGWVSGQDFRYVYKTIDGGLTWNIDFALDRYHMIHTLFAKDNRVWGYGSNNEKHFVVKYSP